GTTDITRTIALGPLTEEMKTNYTLVLKSHIALASARFPEGTTGAQLDKIVRKPLANEGLDFNHGTGHGVGHLLSVHEGPNKISPLGGVSIIREGMITSDEPGLYFEGQYGIRLENEILCVRGKDGMLEFEPITWCPWEREAILPEMLSETEKDWLNRYHRAVDEKLQPLLDEETAAWLKIQTEIIH
ncbi:MAG: M24 family metallopeptidase, partial [bacterium]|nr:M24 family metallopeptidase [bacterium]